LEGDIGFVVVCGKYRTGKSFMLNKLLNTSGDGVKKNLNNLVQS
jgi:GTPase Era involved in 16S rRNA processing